MLLNSLNKSERLKSSRLIGEIISSGESFTVMPLKFFWDLCPGDKNQYPAKMAVSVSSRNFKRAVDRNLIKRRIREAYRINKLELYKYLSDNNLFLNSVILYMPKTIFTYQQMEESIKKILDILINHLQSQNISKLHNHK
ncbi:MAG: hypothetical protein AMS27_06460 [Bacteroides sp. SM23_62_1]|nr:MAG: hypothetical protein AMS27_06460 [Bacteroides sp. SM23_62_1]